MKQQKHVEVWNQSAFLHFCAAWVGHSLVPPVPSPKVPQVEYVDHHIEIPVAKHVPLLQNFEAHPVAV